MSQTVQFVDVTLRDGQQSLAATRMTTEQALRVLKMIDEAGFAALEIWGGATLDNCIRYLDEDPWERLEKFCDALGSSRKIRAVLRGQNLCGYQPVADDLVIAFIKQALKSGVGIIRMFDALDDIRNLQIPILATKAYDGIVEGALAYTTSPIHNVDYFVQFALNLHEQGVDQIAIKDVAGLLYPTDALQLYRKLKENVPLPIATHSHCTTGVSTLNAVIAMQEGIDFIDTAITPFAGGTSHPPIEVLIVFAEEMGIEHGLDADLILKIQEKLFVIFEELGEHIPPHVKTHQPISYDDIDRKKVGQIANLVAKADNESIEKALPLMRELLMSLNYPKYDERIFEAQVPGGMLTNLYKQLQENNQMHHLEDILQEIPAVRQDAGYVPLVSPTSQVIGSQASFNVMAGERYKVVSSEFRKLLKGEFGRPPGLTNANILRKVLQPGDFFYKYRPGSHLPPVLEDDYDLPFIKSHKDLLLYLLFRQSAELFLRKQYGLDSPPPDISLQDWEATPVAVREFLLNKAT